MAPTNPNMPGQQIRMPNKAPAINNAQRMMNSNNPLDQLMQNPNDTNQFGNQTGGMISNGMAKTEISNTMHKVRKHQYL